MKTSPWLRAAVIAVALGACVPAARRDYQPLSSYERELAAHASRTVFPQDVRDHLARLRNHTVAWAGVVERAQVERLSDRIRITLDLQHHYYDWIEHYSPSTAPIWLSPLGEGRVRVVWDVMKDTPDDVLASVTSEDNLVLVYGKPTTLKGARVVLKGLFVRGIGRRHYDTHVVKYGRQAVTH